MALKHDIQEKTDEFPFYFYSYCLITDSIVGGTRRAPSLKFHLKESIVSVIQGAYESCGFIRRKGQITD